MYEAHEAGMDLAAAPPSYPTCRQRTGKRVSNETPRWEEALQKQQLSLLVLFTRILSINQGVRGHTKVLEP